MSGDSAKNETCPNDRCAAILLDIDIAIAGLRYRYIAMLNDRYNLFENHNALCNGHPDYGSWQGHVDKYNGMKAWLRKLVDRAAALGCPIPPAAFFWLGTAAPSAPDCN